MSWARRFVGIRRGGQGAEKGLLQRLLDPIYTTLTALSAQVQAHARLAPTATLEEEVEKLALGIGAQAERIGTMLDGHQLARPDASAAEVAAQPSHWARLVQDLELLRQARGLLLDAYARLNEVDPSLAAELEDCNRRVDDQLHRLRSLIARADPQAIN